MLLFRTHKFDPYTEAFCTRLAAESGLEVVCLVDESRASLDVGGFRKLAITSDAVAALRLHRPPRWQWRCGDYGLYLAARAFPEVKTFWLVEYDVRIRTPGSLQDFFDGFAADGADLIAPLMSQRDYDWWWYPAMRVRDQPVFGCLFPVLRASAPLLQAALEERQRISRSPLYRLFWPNDESFFATIAVRRGFETRDLNGGGRLAYTDESFSFETPLSGEALEARSPDGLVHHPVLYGADYVRKRDKVAKPSGLQEVLQRKLRNRLSRFA